MLRRILPLFVMLLLFSVPAFAQTDPSPEVGKAYRVSFSWAQGTTAAATGFRLYLCPGTVTVCNTKVGNDIPLSALQSGNVVVDMSALANRGPYTVQASAFNLDKESRSAVKAFTVVSGDPAAPGTPVIVIIASLGADGNPVFRWKFIDETTANQIIASR